jgi:hypothetical protein
MIGPSSWGLFFNYRVMPGRASRTLTTHLCVIAKRCLNVRRFGLYENNRHTVQMAVRDVGLELNYSIAIVSVSD